MHGGLIPNPSFEGLADDGGPRDWEIEGGDAADFLVKGGAHTGNHCVELKPTGRRLSWSAEPLRVGPGQDMGLEWWMKIEGTRPWHWTYWTNFTGVELEYLSANGERIGLEARRLRCLRTVDWQRAWSVFRTPPGTGLLRVSFVLDSPTHIEMKMQVDDVRLTEVPGKIPEAMGRLSIRAREAEGAATLARFFVSDSTDGARWPTFSYPFKEGRFYHLNDPELNYLDLPPGNYRVRATKGPDFRGDGREVRVERGKETKVDLMLTRTTPHRDGSWVGGDHHVHLFFHKSSVHPQMTVDDVMKIAKGEGLNYVSFCGEWTEFVSNLGNHSIARDESFVGQIGLESVNDFYGHTCTMGWRELPPQGIPMRCVPWPMNTDTIESLEEMGGAWINAHPFDRITPGRIVEDMGNPEKLCNARELPIILALGHRTCFDILCHSTPGGAELKTAEYYRLLNMGFRIGITASTDFYVDQARGTPGHNRTYVRAGSLDFSKIHEAYREGRTYATNGPLVELEIEGRRVGDEIDLPPGEHVLKGSISAYSRMGLRRARIIVNGKALRTFEADGDWIRESFEVPVAKSSWIAAHVEGPVDDDIEPWDLTPDQRNLKNQFAHTSPVFVRVGDKPIGPAREDVDFLIAWIDAAVGAFHRLDRIWEGHPEESYLASSYPEADRRMIKDAFEKRAADAKAALTRLLG